MHLRDNEVATGDGRIMCRSGVRCRWTLEAGGGTLEAGGGRGTPQVGTAEGGVDSAIEQLRGHGYKVGRVEQLETAKEAKQRRGPQVPAVWARTVLACSQTWQSSHPVPFAGTRLH